MIKIIIHNNIFILHLNIKLVFPYKVIKDLRQEKNHLFYHKI